MVQLIFTILTLSSTSFADMRMIDIQIQKQLRNSFQNASNQPRPTEKKFEQKIDHFNKSDLRVFEQRYFLNSAFVTKDPKNAPVLFYICGESTCDGASGTPAVDETAKKLGAHIVALEHRYYGYSQPFKTLTSQNLKYLSTAQALEDLANFQSYAQTRLNLAGKWIAIGGSYPGSLAAFYRLKHPEMVVGALASSAPVLAKADFIEYDRHVSQVAGPECLKAIQLAVVEAEAQLATPASTLAVKKLFKSEEVKDNTDFLYVLADMGAMAVQYGYHEMFCDALIQGSKDGKILEAYSKVGNKLARDFGLDAVKISFQSAESLNPDDYLGFTGLRSWMYQSCTEYGYYQTAHPNPTLSSRSARISLDYHNQVCKRLFGIHQPVDEQKTNSKYYELLFQSGVKNIYFTNGANDPWSNLSITENDPNSGSNPGIQFFTIPGAAHCDDLGDMLSPGLKTARAQFQKLAKQWLK